MILRFYLFYFLKKEEKTKGFYYIGGLWPFLSSAQKFKLEGELFFIFEFMVRLYTLEYTCFSLYISMVVFRF